MSLSLSFPHIALSTFHAVTSGLDDERQLSVFTRLACGAVAGTTGQTVAYPLDVVRRRLQVSDPYLMHIVLVIQCCHKGAFTAVKIGWRMRARLHSVFHNIAGSNCSYNLSFCFKAAYMALCCLSFPSKPCACMCLLCFCPCPSPSLCSCFCPFSSFPSFLACYLHSWLAICCTSAAQHVPSPTQYHFHKQCCS